MPCFHRPRRPTGPVRCRSASWCPIPRSRARRLLPRIWRDWQRPSPPAASSNRSWSGHRPGDSRSSPASAGGARRGWRGWRACRSWFAMPPMRTSGLLALVENLQREDLNPIEEALAFRRLADAGGMTHGAIASEVGRSRTAVTNTLRLLELTPQVRRLVETGKLRAAGRPGARSARRPQPRLNSPRRSSGAIFLFGKSNAGSSEPGRATAPRRQTRPGRRVWIRTRATRRSGCSERSAFRSGSGGVARVAPSRYNFSPRMTCTASSSC